MLAGFATYFFVNRSPFIIVYSNRLNSVSHNPSTFVYPKNCFMMPKFSGADRKIKAAAAEEAKKSKNFLFPP